MKWASNILIIIGVILLSWFGYETYQNNSLQNDAMAQALQLIERDKPTTTKSRNGDIQTSSHDSLDSSTSEQTIDSYESFTVQEEEAFAILDIDALDRSVPVVEGTSPDDLAKGVGHLPQSSLPGGENQILLSGHRDTVFRDFGQLEIGDTFTLHMPYGSFRYEMRHTDIVSEDDRTVIREMDEEILVITTCYPFEYINNAPERYVIYAYPIG
ncbi:class D sortase [Alkalicoccobacillus plakortidis]|uniref:Class D sortase n=1 Tax=Alkalicoccobacillus plakortidis TaxID=444060 RepID=A0ABT0XNZ9_9BACI|nr:class D sortase [Alkalicoccobacillus plakortidis]MCM2677627.1 class D sortase [Alkalicoccobacillus plakortidis]